jgi:hypothetical protein
MQTPFMAGEDPMRPPAARADMRLTYEHFVLFPDDGKRHEIIDGEHVVTPSPNVRHQVRLALGSWGACAPRAGRWRSCRSCRSRIGWRPPCSWRAMRSTTPNAT